MSIAANAYRWFFNEWKNLNNWIVPVIPLPAALVSTNNGVSAAGAAKVITYAAVPGRRHVITGVHCGYDDDPAAGSTLKIEDGSGNIRYQIPITAGGAAPINFPEPIMGTENTAMIVTLSAAGGAILGYLNVTGKTTDGKAPPTTQS